MFNIVTS